MRCPRAREKRISRPRAATGLHSRALRPGARSWLKGVAGPRTGSVARTPCNDTAVARREAPACFERNMRLTERVSRLIGAPRPRHSCRGRTPRSPCGLGAQREGRLTRGRSNNTGADACPERQHGACRCRPAPLASRIMLPAASTYDELTRKFRWQIPPRYNIGVDVCDKWAARDPSRLAILDVRADGREQRITFGALRDMSNRLANVLRAHGIARGDRVA